MAQPPPGWNFGSNNLIASEVAWSAQAPAQQYPAPPSGIYPPLGNYPPPPVGYPAPPAGYAPPPAQYTPSYGAPGLYEAPSAPLYGAPGGSCPTWVDVHDGIIPPTAIAGGYDNEQLFVGRANHEGALIPGKVIPSHRVCYVPWGGREHGKPVFQVLCGCNAMWVPCVGGEVPPDALPSGETENGEPLFVGRVQHNGTMTLGKVQESHRVCYIPYAGQEMGFPEYEVLVAK